jgi:glycosyltransferase involved in cell wall biosynthesis
MEPRRLKVAWCSYFPVEWLASAPEAVRSLPKRHPASWLQSCANEFAKRPGEIDLQVIELSKGVPHDISFVAEGVTYHCLRVPGGWRAPSLFWLDTFLIRRKLKQIQPAVVHGWGTEKGAALVATRLPYPHLVSLQGLLEYFAGLLPPTVYDRITAHFERVSLRRARVASGESTFVVRWLREHYPRLEVHHVEHSPLWTFWNLPRCPQTRPLQFLAVGSLSYRKGTDLLLQALDVLKDELDFRLTLIGFFADPQFMASVKAQTSPALWERVTILETAPTAAVLEQLSRATVVLFPTRADTGPVAVKEAVVAGVPVVGSQMGGIPDYVTPGKNGFVFPTGDLRAFIQAIREACRHPLFSAGQVDPGTLAAVRERLAPSRMADGFLEIYRRLGRS